MKGLHVPHIQPKIHIVGQPRLHGVQSDRACAGKGDVGLERSWFGLKPSISARAVNLSFQPVEDGVWAAKSMQVLHPVTNAKPPHPLHALDQRPAR